MSNIQKTLDSLKPYVIGIRYQEGIVLVDVVFKDGWVVPDDKNIKIIKGDNEMNYYMLFSQVEGIGVDDLLAYVEKTIKLNLEKEKKLELLRAKVEELKELFKKNSLAKLNKLNFVFDEIDNEIVISNDSIDEDKPDPNTDLSTPLSKKDIPIVNNTPKVELESSKTPLYLDSEGNPIELTEEEKELIEEEARAEVNRNLINARKEQAKLKPKRKIELPPKRKLEPTIMERDDDSECNCGPDQACNKCMDKKGY